MRRPVLAAAALLLISTAAASAFEMNCGAPRTYLGEDRSANPVTKIVIKYSPDDHAWRVFHYLRDGLVVSRSEQYAIMDASNDRKTQWQGSLNRQRNLYMIGEVKRVEDGILYLEWMYDRSKNNALVMHAAARCAMASPPPQQPTSQAPTQPQPQLPAPQGVNPADEYARAWDKAASPQKEWEKALRNRGTMVAAVAASIGLSTLCHGIPSTSIENLVFMMNMHGFMNDAQFQAEMKAKLVEQITMLGDHPDLKEATCAYANLVNTYANDLHRSAENLLREYGSSSK